MKQGVKLLEPLLVSRGFRFNVIGGGRGSGGDFAVGEFRRIDRSLELHFRYSLGLVTYHLGALSMGHIDYMRSVLGKRYASHYPAFSDEPLDAFRDLLLDLEAHCCEFLEGTDEVLSQRIAAASQFRNEPPRIPD